MYRLCKYDQVFFPPLKLSKSSLRSPVHFFQGTFIVCVAPRKQYSMLKFTVDKIPAKQ